MTDAFFEHDPIWAEAVNRTDETVLLSDGQIIPVESWLDDEAEPTDEVDLAMFAICELPDGDWLTVDLREFESVEFH